MFFVVFSPPVRLLICNAGFEKKKGRGNSGSKKRKRGQRVVVGRRPWARRPQGLGLSHCVALWFGAKSHIFPHSLVSTPEGGNGAAHKLDPRSSWLWDRRSSSPALQGAGALSCSPSFCSHLCRMSSSGRVHFKWGRQTTPLPQISSLQSCYREPMRRPHSPQDA